MAIYEIPFHVHLEISFSDRRGHKKISLPAEVLEFYRARYAGRGYFPQPYEDGDLYLPMVDFIENGIVQMVSADSMIIDMKLIGRISEYNRKRFVEIAALIRGDLTPMDYWGPYIRGWSPPMLYRYGDGATTGAIVPTLRSINITEDYECQQHSKYSE